MACKCFPGCTEIASNPKSMRCQCGGYQTGGKTSACVETSGSFVPNYPAPSTMLGGTDRCATMTGLAKTNCLQAAHDASNTNTSVDGRATALGGADPKKANAPPSASDKTKKAGTGTDTNTPAPNDTLNNLFKPIYDKVCGKFKIPILCSSPAYFGVGLVVFSLVLILILIKKRR